MHKPFDNEIENSNLNIITKEYIKERRNVTLTFLVEKN